MNEASTALSPQRQTARPAGKIMPDAVAPHHVTSPKILLYSDDSAIREQVRLAVGMRLAIDAPDILWREVATPSTVVDAADSGEWNLLILDGEADKSGGLGLARQLKNECYNCPPIVVLTGRPQDSWLASWSQADAAISRPLDPMTLRATVASLL